MVCFLQQIFYSKKMIPIRHVISWTAYFSKQKYIHKALEKTKVANNINKKDTINLVEHEQFNITLSQKLNYKTNIGYEHK